MHTHKKGLDTYWDISISDKKYVRFFIWQTAKAMQKAIPDKGNIVGHCTTFSWAITKRNNKVVYKSGRKFAEIHLVRDQISAKLVTHEVLHLIHYWMEYNWMNVVRDDEIIARFGAEVVNGFWRIFWERYKERKTKTSRYYSLLEVR